MRRFALLLLASVLMLFSACRLKDVYSIENIEVSKGGRKMIRGFKSVSLVLTKSYHSNSDSPITLTPSGMEPGIRGIDPPILQLEIYAKHGDSLVSLNNSLRLKAPPLHTLDSLVYDMNKGERYTRGIRMNKEEIRFDMLAEDKYWNDSIVLVYRDAEKTIRKVIP